MKEKNRVLPGKRIAIAGRVGWLPMVILTVAGSGFSTPSSADAPTPPEISPADTQLTDLRRFFEHSETSLQDADFLWHAESWSDFERKARELASRSLRLIDVEIHAAGDEIHYVGVWRSGVGSFALWTCPSWDSFNEQWQVAAMNGLRLVDLEVYSDKGQTLYFGLFRETTGDSLLWQDQDWNDVSR